MMTKALVRQAFAKFESRGTAGNQGFDEDMKVEELDRMLRDSLEGAGLTVDTKMFKASQPKPINQLQGAKFNWFYIEAKGPGSSGGEIVIKLYGMAINRYILAMGGQGPTRAKTLRSRRETQDFVVEAWKSATSTAASKPHPNVMNEAKQRGGVYKGTAKLRSGEAWVFKFKSPKDAASFADEMGTEAFSYGFDVFYEPDEQQDKTIVEVAPA